MAISFVGSAVGSSSPNTKTSITLPTLAADDLIIIAAAVGDTADNGIPAPTGYSRVPGVSATLYANDVNDTNLDLYYKIAVAGDSGALVTLTATGGNNASNAGVAMVFRGIDTTTPFDVNAATATGIDTSNADPPSLDHLNPAGVWTAIAASTGHTGTATATFTFPSGYTTNAAQRAHNDTIDVLVGMGYNTAPADPENPGAFSAANIGTAAANAWAAVTMALRPATSGALTPSAAVAAYSVAAPTLVKGGVTKTPSSVAMAFSVAAPVVLNVRKLLPSAVSMVYTLPAHTLLTGGVVKTPNPVAMAFTTTAPVVVKGIVTLTPAAIAMLMSTQGITLIEGPVLVQPSPVGFAFSVQTPVVSAGGGGPQTLTPAAVIAAFSVAAPTVVRGTVVLTPTPIIAQFAVITPTVLKGPIILTPAAASMAFGVSGVTVITGPTILTPDPVTGIFSVAVPVLQGGEQAAEVVYSIAYWSRWLGWWWAKNTND